MESLHLEEVLTKLNQSKLIIINLRWWSPVRKTTILRINLIQKEIWYWYNVLINNILNSNKKTINLN